MEGFMESSSTMSLQPTRPSLASSPLMNKAPVEIRLQIFRLVLQSDSKFVRPVRRGVHCCATRLDTTLFDVTKRVSQEAQDVFFDLYTVIISDVDVARRSIPLIRRIEFRGGLALPHWRARIYRAGSPKLKTVVLARENFAKNVALRDYLKSLKRDNHLQCVGLGLFKVQPDDGVERQIFIKHFDLCKRLPATRVATNTGIATALRLDTPQRMFESARKLSVMSEGKLDASTALLAFGLTAYERSRSRAAETSLTPHELALVALWERTQQYQPHSIRRTHAQLPNGVKLEDLNVAEHGAGVVEWASELIGLNMHGMAQEYRRSYGKPLG